MKYDLTVQTDGPLITSELAFDSGQIRETIIRQVLNTQERLVREKLIELGWAPPERIEQLEEQLAEEKSRRVKEVNAAHMSAGTFDAMGELASAAMAEEYEYLSWFASNASRWTDVGDFQVFMRERYESETGKPVPLAWRGE